jgi:hypothetical protein
VLLWLTDDTSAPRIGMPLHWRGEGSVPVTVHRSSWTDPNATYLGLKGGSPSANHGQMDTGSFVLDAEGVRWALDLGAEGYHGIESRGMNLWNMAQGSDRWTIFRQQNKGHNTLVIDGQPQRVGGHGRFVAFSDDPAFPHSIMDMSAVYAGQARSVRRGVALLPSGAVLVQDELAGLKPGARVRWGMITRGEATEPGEKTLTLRDGDARLQMDLLSPATSRWQIVDTETPRNEWDSPNPGTRMVAFEAEAPESGELRLAALLNPGGAEPGEPVALRPLAQWGAVTPGATTIRLGPGVPVNPGVFGVNVTHADDDLLETKEAFRGLEAATLDVHAEQAPRRECADRGGGGPSGRSGAATALPEPRRVLAPPAPGRLGVPLPERLAPPQPLPELGGVTRAVRGVLLQAIQEHRLQVPRDG